MNFLCLKLTVILILFEGSIFQCGATDEPDDVPSIEINIVDLLKLPEDMIEYIIEWKLYNAGLDVTRALAGSHLHKVSRNVMRRYFEDRLIEIGGSINPEIHEIQRDGKKRLHITGDENILSLFKQFGGGVKRILINYNLIRDKRYEIHANTVKKYAHQLTELRIFSEHIEGIWDEFPNSFPNVKTLIYIGTIDKNPFDLNSMFPNLEYLKLSYGSEITYINDTNCLANVRKLKVLEMKTRGFSDQQIDNVFAHNTQIHTLLLDAPDSVEILHSIEKHLKTLKTFKLIWPRKVFLTKTNDHVYNLSSVISFEFGISDYHILNGDLSFDMPNLQHLYMTCSGVDEHLDFVNSFKSLQSLKIHRKVMNLLEWIGRLHYVQDFIIGIFENDNLAQLMEIFTNFDKTKSKLVTIKFLSFDEKEYPEIEKTMNELNEKLKESNKPIWTLSHGEHLGKDKDYFFWHYHRDVLSSFLMFERVMN